MEKGEKLNLQVRPGMSRGYYLGKCCRADFRDFFTDFDNFTKKTTLDKELDFRHKVLDAKNKVIRLLNAGKYQLASVQVRFFYEELTKKRTVCRDILHSVDEALDSHENAIKSAITALCVKEEE